MGRSRLLAVLMAVALLLPGDRGVPRGFRGGPTGSFPSSQGPARTCTRRQVRCEASRRAPVAIAIWRSGPGVAGHDEGFRAIDISDPVTVRSWPVSRTRLARRHGLAELLLLSIDAPRTNPQCDRVATTGGAPGFDDIRIFDVSNPGSPYVGA